MRLGFLACLAALVSTGGASALELTEIGSYETGLASRAATGPFAFSPVSQFFYVVNAADSAVDLLRLDEGAIVKTGSWDAAALGGAPSAVAAWGEYIAVAVDAGMDLGHVILFDSAGARLGLVRAGVNPKSIAFSPDGRMIGVANEGRPAPDYATDPEGSVTLLAVNGLAARQIGFGGVAREDLDRSVHFAAPAGTTLAQDFEPEGIAFSPDSATLYVTLQENNALAIIDVQSGRISSVAGMGYADFSATTVDVSASDGGIHLTNWPVLSMNQPAGIASFAWGGRTFLVTANEGDKRDGDFYSEFTTVGALTLDPVLYPDHEALQAPEALGGFSTTTARGDADGDGDVDTIFGFGGRNFSILDAGGAHVYDPGSRIERHIAAARPDIFNSYGEAASFDLASGDLGIAPHGLAIASILGRAYLFIGVQRPGGIAMFEIQAPDRARWAGYYNRNDGLGSVAEGSAGPSGPRDLAFIPAAQSPTGDDLLAVSYAASGSFAVYRLD